MIYDILEQLSPEEQELFKEFPATKYFSILQSSLNTLYSIQDRVMRAALRDNMDPSVAKMKDCELAGIEKVIKLMEAIKEYRQDPPKKRKQIEEE